MTLEIEGGGDSGDGGPASAPERIEQQPSPGGEGAAPQPQPGEGAEGQRQPQQPGLVPHEALREAREDAKRLRADNQRIMAEHNRLAGRVDAFFQQRETPQPQQREDPEPDKAADFAGWLEWTVRNTQRELATVKTNYEQVGRAREQEAQHNQRVATLGAAIAPHVAAFRAETPDYDHAAAHVQSSIYQRAVEGGMPPQHAAQAVQGLLMQTAEVAMAWGLNPAKAMYLIAQENGYKPAAAPPRGENGQFLPQQPLKDPPRSLGSTQGGAPSAGVSDVDKMSDAEFEKWMKGGGLRKMYGK